MIKNHITIFYSCSTSSLCLKSWSWPQVWAWTFMLDLKFQPQILGSTSSLSLKAWAQPQVWGYLLLSIVKVLVGKHTHDDLRKATSSRQHLLLKLHKLFVHDDHHGVSTFKLNFVTHKTYTNICSKTTSLLKNHNDTTTILKLKFISHHFFWKKHPMSWRVIHGSFLMFMLP